MENYDVFISCKSEDYPFAEEVYNFLNKNYIKTFLASKELRKLGDSAYREAIENALEEAEHIIVLASKPEYIKAKWVKYEWGLFVNAKINGLKKGNILTILEGFKANAVFALSCYESFSFSDYKESILNYVKTEASNLRAKKAEEQHNKKLEQRYLEEERLKKEAKIKDELVKLAEEYKKCSSQDILVAKIKALRKQIRNDKYICPICSSEVSIDEPFCTTCGWYFSPIRGIEGAEFLLSDKQKAISCYFSNYNNIKKTTEKDIKNKDSDVDLPKLLDKLKTYKTNADLALQHESELQAEIQRLTDQVKKSENKAAALQSTVVHLRLVNNALVELRKERDHQIEDLQNQTKALQQQIINLQTQSNNATQSTQSSSKSFWSRIWDIDDSSNSKESSYFGFIIKQRGNNIYKEVLILAEAYDMSTDYFKDLLSHLPTKTIPTLTKERAIHYASLLQAQGVSVELYHI